MQSLGDYGFKGGDASTLKYPSIDSVRKDFNDMYPGVEDFEYDEQSGNIPILGRTSFM